MENVFEEMLAESTTVDEENEAEEFDHSYDLTDEDLASPEEEESTEAEADEGDNEPTGELNPTNQAFAQMRTQNKEYSQKISDIENLVKSLGMKDIDDFMVKAKDAQIQREAKQKGIPAEVAQELAEIRELKESFIAEREHSAQEAKERNFVSNVQSFVDANKLSNAAVDKLSQDLEKDGLSIDALMDIPKPALDRILSSYVGATYQKNLERKNAIKRELPITQSSKIDSQSLNKEIDAFARQLAGK